MKILDSFKLKLINPCMFEVNNPYYLPTIKILPYGMGVLTAFLRKQNYHVEQEDLFVKFNHHGLYPFRKFHFMNNLSAINLSKEIDAFMKKGEIGIKMNAAIDMVLDSTSISGLDLIGFSIFNFLQFIFAAIMSKRIKDLINTPIVFGGPFINLYGEIYFKDFSWIDYMIIGDGRVPLLNLIESLTGRIPLSQVPNLFYREGEKIISNPQKDYPIEEMCAPDFDGLPLNLYKLEDYGNKIRLPYQISKGCIGSCNFCNYKYRHNRTEFKTYEKIINEITYLKDRYESNIFRFCDDNINNSYEYLEGLCDSFIVHNLNIRWSSFARVPNLDSDILGKMKESGCDSLSIGVESGSDRVLRLMNKGFCVEQADKILKESFRLGIKNAVNLISGYPYESEEDVKKTIEFVKRSRKYIHYVQAYPFYLAHGSNLHNNPKNYGIFNRCKTVTRFTFAYAFDELRGEVWEERQKKVKRLRKQLEYAILKHVRVRKLLFGEDNLFRRIFRKLSYKFVRANYSKRLILCRKTRLNL